MKSILLALVTILSVQAQAVTIKTAELEASLAEIIAKNNAQITQEAKAELLDKFQILAQLTDEQRRLEISKTRIQKFATCRLADVAIIANGVGEALPIAAVGVREVNSRFVGVEIDPVTTAALQEDRISWKNLLGGGLDSIVGVSIETLASWDLKKVESEIQKSFPATQIMAVKMKGEASYCGQSTLKLDMLKALEAKATVNQ